MRFYAAEALAYLDRREAAEPLGQIARDQPAFRVFALTALSAMQDYAAYEQLRDLLSVAQRRNPLRRLPRAVDHEREGSAGQGRSRSAASSTTTCSTWPARR